MSTSNQGTSQPVQLTRAEQEVHTAAERLTTQIESALRALGINSDDAVELEACADRLERASRDMAVALRELAERRSNSPDEE